MLTEKQEFWTTLEDVKKNCFTCLHLIDNDTYICDLDAGQSCPDLNYNKWQWNENN